MRRNTWGRFIKRSAAYQPWIYTAGNHELDFVRILVIRILRKSRRITYRDDTATAKLFCLSGSKLQSRDIGYQNRTYAYFGWHRNNHGFSVKMRLPHYSVTRNSIRELESYR
nr:uncharacterized protein LOC108943179 isoform X2 [Nicotiana tomentosiformis]